MGYLRCEFPFNKYAQFRMRSKREVRIAIIQLLTLDIPRRYDL